MANCKKEKPVVPPSLTTLDVNNITWVSALSGGEISFSNIYTTAAWWNLELEILKISPVQKIFSGRFFYSEKFFIFAVL